MPKTCCIWGESRDYSPMQVGLRSGQPGGQIAAGSIILDKSIRWPLDSLYSNDGNILVMMLEQYACLSLVQTTWQAREVQGLGIFLCYLLAMGLWLGLSFFYTMHVSQSTHTSRESKLHPVVSDVRSWCLAYVGEDCSQRRTGRYDR